MGDFRLEINGTLPEFWPNSRYFPAPCPLSGTLSGTLAHPFRHYQAPCPLSCPVSCPVPCRVPCRRLVAPCPLSCRVPCRVPCRRLVVYWEWPPVDCRTFSRVYIVSTKKHIGCRVRVPYRIACRDCPSTCRACRVPDSERTGCERVPRAGCALGSRAG